MKDTNSINILQYNVRNDRVSTMIPLLADSNTQDYDVIAIQEPWRSTHAPTTLSSHQSGFHLLYRPGGDTRVCFYVNEKIDPESWEVEFPTADLCTLKLNVSTDGVTRTLHIHNVYNPSPSSYSSTDSPSTLPAVRQQLAADAQHVLLGDFNLHHPFWNGVTRPTQHAAADQLLDIVEEFDLSLTLPKGTVTWEARNSFSTIDLVFMSEFLTERLEHCMSRPEMNQSSDHIPISTRILLGSEQLTQVKRRAWKLLNMEKLREAESNAPPVTHPRSAEEIDQYAQTIQEYLQKIIAASVPWARPSEYAKPFWNEECNRAIRETRKLRRSWSSSRHMDDWKAYMKSNDKKQKIIRKAKMLSFRKEISAVTESPLGIWKLARWAKDRSQKPREIPKMPPLRHGGQTAETFEEKAEMLKAKFFPPPPPADLSDIPGSFYPAAADCPMMITKNEVIANIQCLKSDKAPGPDGITNKILKACSTKLAELLTPLFQACVTQAYHPREFKRANTITLKKPGKKDNTSPKAYRPIALLNTMGKVLEAVIAKKITHIAEQHRLLPDTQMGARRGRSTESALELLTEQVYTVWGQGNDKVATLLSMDVAGAFDTVSHRRLIHNLRKRKIPKWITDWTASFLENRKTTLAINRRATGEFAVRTGIPQGSPISPILYLFYNADLLEICQRPGTNTSALGFVDDVNVLAYGKSTEENCRTLERIHRKCELWATRHGSVFAPDKYELIHLSRNPKKFNMTATIQIETNLIEPKTDIRVLGLQIDTKLKWGAHIRKTQEKMTSQSLALTKISASTWGASFAKARQVYTSVVRPAMTYGSAVWHTPKEIKKNKATMSKLSVMQNKCLRTVAGAFKATPVEVLEAETFIAPMELHLDHLQMKARYRLRASGQAKLITTACSTIANKLRGKAGRKRIQRPTLGDLKHEWASKMLNNEAPAAIPPPPRPWSGPDPVRLEKYITARRIIGKHAKTITVRIKERWETRWKAYQDRVPYPTEAQLGPLNRTRLKIHDNLMKAESALTTQIRTEKIGLANFLFNRRVPGAMTPACSCGWQKQTAKHIILHCRLIEGRYELLRQLGTHDYRTITRSSKMLKKLTAWIIKANLLTQFSLASQMLYEI